MNEDDGNAGPGVARLSHPVDLVAEPVDGFAISLGPAVHLAEGQRVVMFRSGVTFDGYRTATESVTMLSPAQPNAVLRFEPDGWRGRGGPTTIVELDELLGLLPDHP